MSKSLLSNKAYNKLYVNRLKAQSIKAQNINKEEEIEYLYSMTTTGSINIEPFSPLPQLKINIEDINEKNIIKSLDDYIENLAHINSLIKKDRFNEVESQLKSTNYIKTILKGIN